MKTCTRCRKAKPLTSFYKSSRTKDGYQSWCKACTKTYRREHKKEYRAYSRKYRRTHEAQVQAYNRAYYQQHKAAYAGYGRSYYRTEEGKQTAARAHDRYRKTRKGKRTYTRARSVRRVRSTATETDVTEEGMLDLVATYEVCPYCGNAFEAGGGLVWDHVVPLSKGGTHTLDNLLPCCAKCNSSKGAKLLDEWNERQ